MIYEVWNVNSKRYFFSLWIFLINNHKTSNFWGIMLCILSQNTCKIFLWWWTHSDSNIWLFSTFWELLHTHLLKNLSYSILLTEKLHFVRFWEKTLWKSPDLTPRANWTQTRISWLNVQELVVYLGNRDQSETNTQPFERKWPIRHPPT